MSTIRILAIDDEIPILELLKYNLEKEGFHVTISTNGEDALQKIKTDLPDLILLDLMLPGISGLDICRRLKDSPKTKDIPVIMLTAKTEDSDIILGLELGADDYMTKPFSPKVLIARIRTILRRKNKPQAVTDGKRTAIHGIEIDPERHEIYCDGEVLLLSVTEFMILEYLAQNPGRVFSRAQIISSVKGSSYPVTERSIDVQILSIRKKLGAKADFIETVRGIGYKMKDGS